MTFRDALGAAPDREQEIAARLHVATPAPWEWTGHVGTPHTDCAYTQELNCERGGVLFHEAAWPVRDADADFIAAAPEDVRWLLTELRRAREERDDARSLITHVRDVMQEGLGEVIAERDQLRARVTALEGALRELTTHRCLNCNASEVAAAALKEAAP